MKPDFPSLADEIAEPRPDMNIKVAAFTVSEKSSNTLFTCWVFFHAFLSSSQDKIKVRTGMLAPNSMVDMDSYEQY